MILEPRFPAALGEGPPLLMVVIDTEEEFDWHASFSRASTDVTNIAAQHLGQAIFTGAGIRPTYVIDYPVAASPTASAILKEFADAGHATIGAHLHPWVTPPYEEAVTTHNSYAGNLPEPLERAKLRALTETITSAIGCAPTIFKAGRYGLGPHTGAILTDLGYTTDLSVVPFTDFRFDGGPDYRGWPDQPFWTTEPGRMFCIPMTRGYSGRLPYDTLHRMAQTGLGRRLRLPGLLARGGLMERATLTPEGIDLAAHKRLVRAMIAHGHRVFTLSYHSPSLSPGHTPYVRTTAERDAFLGHLQALVEFILGDCAGQPTTPAELRAMALVRNDLRAR